MPNTNLIAWISNGISSLVLMVTRSPPICLQKSRASDHDFFLIFDLQKHYGEINLKHIYTCYNN